MWWDVTVSPILGADGKPEQLLSVSRDITQRKQAEQATVELFEQRRLHIAGTEKFDVLLSDIGLPDGDGWELLRQLNAARTCPPSAIAMSGFGLSQDVARSKAAGYVLHLIKPFDPAALEKALLMPPASISEEAPLQSVLCHPEAPSRM